MGFWSWLLRTDRMTLPIDHLDTGAQQHFLKLLRIEEELKQATVSGLPFPMAPTMWGTAYSAENITDNPELEDALRDREEWLRKGRELGNVKNQKELLLKFRDKGIELKTCRFKVHKSLLGKPMITLFNKDVNKGYKLAHNVESHPLI